MHTLKCPKCERIVSKCKIESVVAIGGIASRFFIHSTVNPGSTAKGISLK